MRSKNGYIKIVKNALVELDIYYEINIISVLSLF